MKKVFTTLFSIIALTSSLAQPALNSFTVPLAGPSTTYKIGSNFNLNVGNSGNQNWDFSAVTYLATTTDNYTTPSTAPHGSEFPSSNLVHVDFTGTNFYNWTSTGKTWYGMYDDNDYVKYSDPIVMYNLPLAYNVASATDSYAGTKYDSDDATTFTVAGTASTLYDGYGSIKTVYGTYSNVVRIKTTMTETQTNTTNSEVTSVTSIFYEWYTTSGVLLFAIQHIVSDGPSLDFQAKFIFAYNIITTSILDQSNDHELSAGPNPTSDILTLHLSSLPSSGVYDINIFNNTGTLVSSNKEYLDQFGQKQIDVSSLKEGAYILNISTEKTTAHYKFIKK